MTSSDTSPTARSLLTLELLQSNPGITAERLADRLGVSSRAARRHVAILGEAGRALPHGVAAQAEAARTTTAPSPDRGAARPDPEITSQLVEACSQQRRVQLHYRSESGKEWEGQADPWAVVVRHGRWYLLCHSHASQATRAYRIDRVQRVDRLEQTFHRTDDLDPVVLLEEHLAVGWEYDVDDCLTQPTSPDRIGIGRGQRWIAVARKVDSQGRRAYSRAVSPSASDLAPRDHLVILYEDDHELVAEVASFVLTGLRQCERVIVVSTAAHRALLEQSLSRSAVDLAASCADESLVLVDAGELLASFTSAGGLDRDRFSDAVGDLVQSSVAAGTPVRIFGEMVALLWDSGDVLGALELERWWNELGARWDFALLCAYPITLVGTSTLGEVDALCASHCVVEPPRHYADGATDSLSHRFGDARDSRVFLGVPAAVPAVRRYVAAVLAEWGHEALVPDAILVASELATNAVRHAHSPFRVTVERKHQGSQHQGSRRQGIRIAVEDREAIPPALCARGGESTSGRGVLIVRDVCAAWGSDHLPDGKVVWADLAAHQPMSRD
jgi:anti-sigma regulatory factor (Ser/Thr protein kinase)